MPPSARRGALAFLLLLVAVLPARAQRPAGPGDWTSTGRARPAPVPCVLVAEEDGSVHAVSLQELPAPTRRKLQPARLLTPEQRDAGSEAAGPTITTTTAGNASAAATITVNYTGFSDEAQTAFQRAVDIWAEHLESSVTITVNANFDDDFDDDNVLGAAGPTFFRGLQNEAGKVTFFPDALADAVLGRNIDEEKAEISAHFNSEFNWYFGAEPGGASRGQFDFTTVVLHELGHGLGFLGSMDVEDGVGSYGLGEDDIPIIYDRFAEDVSGDSLLNNSIYPNPSEVLGDTLTDGDDPDSEPDDEGDGVQSTVRFDGPQARLGAPEAGEPGSPRPKLYTPDMWDEGSSYSHLDEDEYPGAAGDPDALMTPQFGQQEAARSPGGITCGIFADMGWPLGPACRASLGADISSLENVEAALVTTGGRNQVRVQFTATIPATVDSFVVARCFGICTAGDPAARPVARVEAQAGQNDYSVTVGVPTPGRYTFLVRQISVNDVEIVETTTVNVTLDGDFTLSGAFPNPFQKRTELRLVMGEDQQSAGVTATLYDARGRRVRTLFDDSADDNGQVVIPIQAGNLASGVYYVRVEGEDFSKTRSVVLVR